MNEKQLAHYSQYCAARGMEWSCYCVVVIVGMCEKEKPIKPLVQGSSRYRGKLLISRMGKHSLTIITSALSLWQ